MAVRGHGRKSSLCSTKRIRRVHQHELAHRTSSSWFINDGGTHDAKCCGLWTRLHCDHPVPRLCRAQCSRRYEEPFGRARLRTLEPSYVAHYDVSLIEVQRPMSAQARFGDIKIAPDPAKGFFMAEDQLM